jgi:hypothetical protein
MTVNPEDKMPELEMTDISGRPAITLYLNADFEPVEKEQATIKKIRYLDTGGITYLSIDNRPKTV